MHQTNLFHRLAQRVFAALRPLQMTKEQAKQRALMFAAQQQGLWLGLQARNPFRQQLDAMRREHIRYPLPHQGARECARRRRQLGLDNLDRAA